MSANFHDNTIENNIVTRIGQLAQEARCCGLGLKLGFMRHVFTIQNIELILRTVIRDNRLAEVDAYRI